MTSIDEDAELIGIDPKTWKEFRRMIDEKCIQDDKEAFERRKRALAQRWFGYYKKCKTQKKMKLIDQYNFVATMKQRD